MLWNTPVIPKDFSIVYRTSFLVADWWFPLWSKPPSFQGYCELDEQERNGGKAELGN